MCRNPGKQLRRRPPVDGGGSARVWVLPGNVKEKWHAGCRVVRRITLAGRIRAAAASCLSRRQPRSHRAGRGNIQSGHGHVTRTWRLAAPPPPLSLGARSEYVFQPPAAVVAALRSRNQPASPAAQRRSVSASSSVRLHPVATHLPAGVRPPVVAFRSSSSRRTAETTTASNSKQAQEEKNRDFTASFLLLVAHARCCWRRCYLDG